MKVYFPAILKICPEEGGATEACKSAHYAAPAFTVFSIYLLFSGVLWGARQGLNVFVCYCFATVDLHIVGGS